MLRNLVPLARRIGSRAFAAAAEPGLSTYNSESAVGERKAIEKADFFHGTPMGGYPEEQQMAKVVRIYKQSREATMPGGSRTMAWKIDMEHSNSWENELMGCCAQSGDSLSHVMSHMTFASKKEAMRFCDENNWAFEVDAFGIKA